MYERIICEGVTCPFCAALIRDSALNSKIASLCSGYKKGKKKFILSAIKFNLPILRLYTQRLLYIIMEKIIFIDLLNLIYIFIVLYL